MWEFFEGPWNGDEAVRMYKGPVRGALERAYPDRSRFHILEDNDPSGFQSKEGGCGEEREQNQRLPHPAPLAGPEPL